nr:MAG TPA: hypothetical protein [Caudoviricetes sp.]
MLAYPRPAPRQPPRNVAAGHPLQAANSAPIPSSRSSALSAPLPKTKRAVTPSSGRRPVAFCSFFHLP